MRKRILSVFLAALMFCLPLAQIEVFAVPQMAGVVTTDSETEEVELFAYAIDDATVLERINELYSLLGNTYFNVNQNTDCGIKSSGHGCSYCSTSSIVKKQWFIELFGVCSTDNFANSYGQDGVTYTRSGRSCLGFANFAEWYIFKNTNSDTITTVNAGTYSFNKTNVDSYARVGDILRLDNGHSVIYINSTQNGINVLDCNWGTKNVDYN